MKNNFFIIIIFILIILTGVYFNYNRLLESIYIAVVGPISGSTANVGKSYLAGINMALDTINKNGGIRGKQIKLDIYDDKNNNQLAVKCANEIVNKNRALFVIGHNYSSCSIYAGNIYKKACIPAITPASSHIDVTLENNWYFRLTFNDKQQGQFLAYYAKRVFDIKESIIVHEDLPYGTYLADEFKKTCSKINIKNIFKKKIITSEYSLKDIEYIVNSIKSIVHKKEKQSNSDNLIVFLSVHAPEGIKLVKHIKDAGINVPIITPASLANNAFIEGFNIFLKEKENPGHYTNGIYTATPLIFDTANEKTQHFKELYIKKYDKEPDWRAIFSYDAFMLIADTIERLNISGKSENIKFERKKIRDSIAGLNEISNSYDGISGLLYFDKNGDSKKSISMGVFQNQKIISALIQLQKNITIKKNKEDNRIFSIDDDRLYKTNVVYTGIMINEINKIDFKSKNCELTFNIWFRYRGDININDVVFVNSIDNVVMKLIDSDEAKNGLNYRLFNVKGNFKIDFLEKDYPLDQHELGFCFRHKTLDQSKLIFVKDLAGTQLLENITNKEKHYSGKNLPENWNITNKIVFRNIVLEKPMERLKYLNLIGQEPVKFSKFNYIICLEKKPQSIRGTFKNRYINFSIIVLSIMVLSILFTLRKDFIWQFPKSLWLINSICVLSVLICSENIVTDYIYDNNYRSYVDSSILCFDILWWLIPAYLINLGLIRFIWIPLEKKTNRKIPKILTNTVMVIVFLVAIFGIIAYVFDQKLTSLLATSGVLAMIIGLAIQVNIANIFSGIAINLENPFRIGDWIKIGNECQGKVFDITWRTTRILTLDGYILSFPNSMASESAIHNYSYPDPLYWVKLKIHINPRHQPKRIEKLCIDAISSIEGIKNDKIIVRYELSDWSADFTIIFCISEYGKRFHFKSLAYERIWTHLNRVGIYPAVQRQEIYMFRGSEDRGEIAATNPVTILEEIDIFKSLSEDSKIFLGNNMRKKQFNADQYIIKQGEVGDSLFVVIEGAVSILITIDDHEVEVARLGAGAFFGEMALLTGEPRTASIKSITDSYLYEITKNDIAPLIHEQPEVLDLLSQELASRAMKTESKKDEYIENSSYNADLKNKFLDKIVNFFGVKKHQIDNQFNPEDIDTE